MLCGYKRDATFASVLHEPFETIEVIIFYSLEDFIGGKNRDNCGAAKRDFHHCI